MEHFIPQGYCIRQMKPEDNAQMAVLVRYNLKAHGLDIPGTVYFDPCVDHLCEYYAENEGQGYFVLTDREDKVVGGIGFAPFPLFENCAELQKLYLADEVKGNGLGYVLIEYVEQKMREAGFSASYLETHENLKTALHVYEKAGYRLIPRPKAVAHGAMTHFYYKEL